MAEGAKPLKPLNVIPFRELLISINEVAVFRGEKNEVNSEVVQSTL